jgi:hypothetical protein
MNHGPARHPESVDQPLERPRIAVLYKWLSCKTR